MNIENYTKVEHFINDPSFVNWVKKNDLSDMEFWTNWISNHSDKEDLIFAARDILLGINFKKSYVDNQKVELEWEKLRLKIESPKKEVTFLKSRSVRVRNWSIAASLALLLSFITVYYLNRQSIVVHNASYGEVINLKLSDGTVVVLNSNSSISYKKTTPRIVNLNGEAFFKVSKDVKNNAKFNVITKDLEVEVFGTEFNVNSRNSKTEVFLQEGKVGLKLKNGVVKQMTPGDLISYSYNEDLILEEKKLLKAEIQTSWKEGSLIFEKATLYEAMSKIEETYGVITSFENESIKEILLTGAVPTKNIDIALKTLEKSAQLIIDKEGNKLYIRKK